MANWWETNTNQGWTSLGWGGSGGGASLADWIYSTSQPSPMSASQPETFWGSYGAVSPLAYAQSTNYSNSLGGLGFAPPSSGGLNTQTASQLRFSVDEDLPPDAFQYLFGSDFQASNSFQSNDWRQAAPSAESGTSSLASWLGYAPDAFSLISGSGSSRLGSPYPSWAAPATGGTASVGGAAAGGAAAGGGAQFGAPWMPQGQLSTTVRPGFLGALTKGLTEDDWTSWLPFIGQGVKFYETADIALTAQRVNAALEAGLEPDQADLQKLYDYKAKLDAMGLPEGATGWEKAGYIVGSVIHTMVPFALEFLATGGIYSAGSRVGRAAVERGLSVLTREGVEQLLQRVAARGAAATLGERAAAAAIRGAEWTGGAVTGTLTALPFRWFGHGGSEFLQRTTPFPDIEEIDGRLQATLSNVPVEPWFQAALKAGGRGFAETFSEVLGEPIEAGLASLVKTGAKALPQELQDGFKAMLVNRYLLKNPESTLDDALRALRQRAQFHGPLIEEAEEIASDQIQSLFGIRDPNDKRDWIQAASETATFSLFPMLGAGIRRAVSTWKNIKPEARMAQLLGDESQLSKGMTLSGEERIRDFLRMGGQLLPEEVDAVRGLRSWLVNSGAELRDGVWQFPNLTTLAREGITPDPTALVNRMLRLEQLIPLAPSSAANDLRSALQQTQQSLINVMRPGTSVIVTRAEGNNGIAEIYNIALNKDGKLVATSFDADGNPVEYDVTAAPNESNSFIAHLAQLKAANPTVSIRAGLLEMFKNALPLGALPAPDAELSEQEIERTANKASAILDMLRMGYTVPAPLGDPSVLALVLMSPNVQYDRPTNTLRLKAAPSAHVDSALSTPLDEKDSDAVSFWQREIEQGRPAKVSEVGLARAFALLRRNNNWGAYTDANGDVVIGPLPKNAERVNFSAAPWDAAEKRVADEALAKLYLGEEIKVDDIGPRIAAYLVRNDAEIVYDRAKNVIRRVPRGGNPTINLPNAQLTVDYTPINAPDARIFLGSLHLDVSNVSERVDLSSGVVPAILLVRDDNGQVRYASEDWARYAGALVATLREAGYDGPVPVQIVNETLASGMPTLEGYSEAAKAEAEARAKEAARSLQTTAMSPEAQRIIEEAQQQAQTRAATAPSATTPSATTPSEATAPATTPSTASPSATAQATAAQAATAATTAPAEAAQPAAQRSQTQAPPESAVAQQQLQIGAAQPTEKAIAPAQPEATAAPTQATPAPTAPTRTAQAATAAAAAPAVATGTTAAVEFPVPGGYGSLYPTEPRARAMALLNAARSLGKSGLRQFNYDISPDAAPAQNEPPIVGELRSKLSDITERLESALDLIARGETARAIPTINDAELAFKRFASDLLESRNAVAEAVAREQTAAEAAKQATPKPPATAPVQTPAPPLEQTAQQPPAIAQTQAAQAPAAVAEEARKRAEEHAKRIIAEAVEPAKAAVRASVSRAEQSGAEVAKLVDRAANSGLDKARVDAFRMRLEQAQQAVRTLSKAADEATDIGTLGGILDGVSAEMQKLTVLASEIAAASESLTGQKPIEQPTTEVKAGKVAVIRPAIQHSEVQSHVGSNTKAVQVGDAFIGADSAEADNALQHVKQVGALQGRQRTGGEGQEQVIRIVNELHDINGVLGNPETTQYGSPTVNYQAETVEKSEGGKQVGVQSGTLITGRGRFMAIRLAYSRRDEALNKIAKAVAGKQPILADDVYFAGYVPSGYVRLKGEDVYRHESEIESGAEREPIPTQQNEFHWINRYIAGVKALASELGVADKLPRNPTHVRVLSDFKYVEGKEGKEVPIVEFARESDQTKTLRLTAVERRRALWNAMVAANFVSSLEFNEFGSLTQKSILALKQNFGRDLIGDNDKEINESVVGALVYGGLRRAAVMSFYHDRRNEIVASLALELLNNRDFLANIVGRPIGSVDEFTDADITVIADRLAAHSIYLPADTREARDILFDALSRTETREALLARKLSAAEAIDKYVFPVYAKVLSENAESKRMADALTYAAVKLSSVAGTRYDILPVIATLAANTTDENQVSLISKRPEQWVESVLEPKLGDIQAPESGLAPGERNMLQPVARVLVNYLAGKSGGQSKWRNTIDRYVASAKNEVESAGTPTLGGVAEPRTAAEVWDEATKTMSTGDLFTAQPAAPATPATAAAPATPAPGAVAKAVARATRVGETAQAEKPKAPERAREEGSAYDASRPFSAQSLLALAFDSAHAERVPGSTGPFDGSWFKLAAKVAASTFSDSAAAEEALLDVIGSIESQFSDEAGPSEYRKAGKNIEEFVNRWLGTKLIPKERKDAVRAVAIFKSLQNAESILNGELDVKDFRLTAEDVGNFIQIAIGAAALREVAESIAQQREAQVKKYEDNVRDAINAVNTDVIEGGEIPSGPPFGKNPGEYIRTVRRQTEGLREKVSKTPQERALAPEHVEAFLAYLASRAHQDPDAALVYAYFAIGASTGLRQQEIVSIPASAGAGDHGALVLGDKYWSRIKNADTETTEGGIRTRDYVAGAVYNIRVYKQKSGGPSKIEAVHLSNIAADAIQNWMRFRNRLYEDNNPFLFPSRDKGTGKPIDASDLGDIFRSTMERAVEGARRAVQAGQTVPWAALARDVPGYSAPTDFLPGKTRNTAVQYMVKRAGLPQRDAEAVLGHVVDKNAANYVSARNDAPDARKKMALHFKQLQDEVARLLGEVPSASQKPADLNAWGRLVAAIRRGGAFRKDTIDKNRARLLAFAQTLEQSGIKHKSLVSFIVSLAHGANPILLDSIALGLDNYNRINGVAPAVLEGSLIRLSKTATPSDALHEIIHVIHDVFLTDAEREYIKAVWKQALTNVLNSEPADTKVRDAINKFLSDPSGSGITSEQFVDYAKTAGLDSRTIDSLSALYNPFEFFANVMSPAMLAEAIDAKQSNTAVGRLLSAIRDIGVAAIESVLPQKLGDFAEAVFAAIKSNKTDASATEEAAAALSQWNELADRLVSYFDGMRRNVGVRLREPPQELRYASQLSFGSQVFGDLPEGSAPFSAEPAGEGPLTQVFGRIFRVGGAETVDLEKSVRDAQALAAKHGLNIAVANADARVVPPEPGKVTDITENVKRLIADIRASGQENNPVLANLLRRIAVESVLAGENDRGWRIDPNVASQALETGQPLFRTAGSVLRLAHNMFGLPDTDSLRENPFAAVYVALTNIYDAAPVTTQLVSDIVKVMTTKLSDMLTDEQWDALASDPKFSKLVELALEQQRRQYAARLAGGLIDRLARWLAPAGKPPKNHILYEILKNREVLEYVKRVLSQRGYVKMRREAITPSAALAFLASDAGAADREQTLRGLLWQARRIVARSEWIEDQKKRGLTAEQLASLVANYDAATEDPEQRDKYDKDASITPTEAQFQRGLDRPEFKSWYYLFQSPIHITDWSEVLTSRALAEIFTGITPSQTPKVEKVPLPQNEEWRLILAKHGLSKKFSVRDLAKQPDNVFRAVMDAYRRALEEYVSKITGQRPDAIRDTNTFLEIALQNMESKLLVEISRARAEFLKQRLRPDEVAKEISDIKARTKGWVRSLADLLNADMLLSTYFTDSRQGLRRGLQAFVDVMRSILRAKAESSKAAGLEPVDELTEVAQSTVAEKEKWIEEQLAKIKAEPDVASALKEMDGGEQLAFDNAARLALRWAIFERENQIINREINKVDAYLRSHPGDTAAPPVPATIEPGEMDYDELMRFKDAAAEFQKLINTGALLTYAERGGALPDALKKADTVETIDAMLRALAGSQTVQDVLPKVRDVIRQIFTTPPKNLDEAAVRFADAMGLVFEPSGLVPGLQPQEMLRLKKLFARAFMIRWNAALEQARREARAKLGIDGGKPPPLFEGKAGQKLWEKIEAALFAGDFDVDAVNRLIFSQYGAEVKPEDIESLRRLAEEEWNLRQLTPADWDELAQAGVTPAMYELFQRTGDLNVLQLPTDTDERAKFKRYAAIARKEHDVETRHIGRRTHLQNMMVAVWSRMTRPIKPGREHGVARARNLVDAFNELAAANSISTVWFASRLVHDVFFQTFIGGLQSVRAYAKARAHLRWTHLVATGQKPNWVSFQWDYVRFYLQAFHDYFKTLYKSTIWRAFVAALRSIPTGEGVPARVELVETQIHLNDRVLAQINDYVAKGGNKGLAKAMTLAARLIGNFGFTLAQAADVWTMRSFAAPEARLAVRVALREALQGLVPESEILKYEKELAGRLEGETAGLDAAARMALVEQGIKPTKGAIHAAVSAMLYGRAIAAVKSVLAEALANGDAKNALRARAILAQAEAEVANHLATLAWNRSERSVFGEIIRTPMRGAQAIGRFMFIPTGGFTSFSNAMAYSTVQTLMFTPLGFFPGLFKGSPRVASQIGRYRFQTGAIIGTAAGIPLMLLAALPASIGGGPPPDDEREKRLLEAHNAPYGSLGIPIGDGRYLWLSTTVGPGAMLRFWISLGTAARRLFQKQQRYIEQAVEKSLEKGIPFQPQRLSSGDVFGALASAMLDAVLTGQRISSGKIGAGGTDAFSVSTLARGLSAYVPGAPMANSVARVLRATPVDPKANDFVHLAFQFLPGTQGRVRGIGAPPEGENKTSARIGMLTGGTAPPTAVTDKTTAMALANALAVGEPVNEPDRSLYVDLKTGEARRPTESEYATMLRVFPEAARRNIAALGEITERNPATVRAFRQAVAAARQEAVMAAGLMPFSALRGRTGRASGGKGPAVRFAEKTPAPGLSDVLGVAPIGAKSAPSGRLSISGTTPRFGPEAPTSALPPANLSGIRLPQPSQSILLPVSGTRGTRAQPGAGTATIVPPTGTDVAPGGAGAGAGTGTGGTGIRSPSAALMALPAQPQQAGAPAQQRATSRRTPMNWSDVIAQLRSAIFKPAQPFGIVAGATARATSAGRGGGITSQSPGGIRGGAATTSARTSQSRPVRLPRSRLRIGSGSRSRARVATVRLPRLRRVRIRTNPSRLFKLKV